MKARSIKGNSVEDIRRSLDAEMEGGFRPTLAFVFMSIAQDIEGLRGLLDQKGITIFGATTAGEFIDGELGSGTIVMLLMDMDPSNFLLLMEDSTGRDLYDVARDMARTAKARFNNPAFFLSCSFGVVQESAAVGEPILRGLEEIAGDDVIIWGGRAGDDFRFQRSVVFNGASSSTSAIILLVVDADHVTVVGQSVSGQKPVGTVKEITKAKGNWVYEFDHQPAADVVMKFLGLNLTQADAETFNPGGLVFSLLREKGEPVLRGVGVFNWADRSLMMLGNVVEGDKVRMTLPPDFEVLEEESISARQVKEREIPDPDAVVVFNCMGRLGLFGPLAGDEIEGLRNVFGVPMAGFFTYGEFGRAERGNNEFHNHTCCWVALKEK
jgi:hypothetical protein